MRTVGITTKDICWLAGWLEGEGSFMWTPNGRAKNLATIVGSSTDLDVVQRAAGLLGEKPLLTRPRAVKRIPDTWVSTKPLYRTRIRGARAIGWMMTLYPMMGVRRKEKIREILEKWKVTPHGRAAVAIVRAKLKM